MEAFPLSYTTILVVVALSYLIYSTSISISHKLRARRLGCKPAYARPGWLFLGIGALRRSIIAAKEQVLQNDEVAVYEELGCRPTWVQNILGGWYHFTADPDNIKAILATQFKDFELGPFRFNLLGPLLGHGIFTTDGQEWQHHRALLRPQFTRSQISNLSLEETHVQHLLNRLSAGSDSWTAEVDLAPLFFNLTLDSATEFLFGQSVESQVTYGTNLDSSNPDKPLKRGSGETDWSSFGRAFDRANATIAIQGQLMDLYFLYSPKSLTKDCQEVHRLADYFVQKALKEDPETSDKDGESSGHGYVFLRELAKTTRDPYMLRSQLLNILLAGRDTTAGLLGWTFYRLARHPDYFAKLHTVIVETFGKFSSNTSSITFESLKSCHHLQHLLSEVLRLHPVVPENSRRAVRNTTLPRGGGEDGLSPIYIRKGEEVIYNVHVMHHRKDIWGEDADEFRPERWTSLKHGWEYLPFNGGPRICIGQQFALTEAGYVVARMLQKYDKIENLDPDPVIRHQYTQTTAPARALVRLHEASHE
ncbi:cytochrome P450 [Pochonia chlamydosporia 170]|uniref:Cytochrome P450 n=1 Tax=Pochonia chlamydosporia 170 TaxID=1380566 RepID=A0A179FFX9_METCM|nr:cytochrome P450 [Pochonia chlamydosporia 170]OAQ64432.1 cytochrome P450 [Pochonia chlamydosporia 170]